MAKRMTPDEMVLRIMLDPRNTEAGRQRKLTTLSQQVRRMMGEECPECGGTDVQDNGAPFGDMTYCCLGCGHQWDAVEGD